MSVTVSYYPGNVACYHPTPVTCHHVKRRLISSSGISPHTPHTVTPWALSPAPCHGSSWPWCSLKVIFNLQLKCHCTPNSILLLIGFNCLSQEEVDLVIAKGKKALGKAKPAMIRLTFHDCVGKFWYWSADIEKICVHSHRRTRTVYPIVISAWYWFPLNLNDLVWMASLTPKTRL